MIREIVFDTETTGFDPATGDRVLDLVVCDRGNNSVVVRPGLGLPNAVRPAVLPALTLSPNPARETVLLTGLPATAAPLPATLRNALGQVVRELRLTPAAGQASLSVAGLAAGAYTLHLTTTEGPAVRRLVVE